jgi:IclR family pca regulon transcriptional regulator
MTSLARGLSVIRAFSERQSHLTIAEIARSAGLPRAAARRCLHTLAALGYAGSDGRTFFLRPKVLALGYSYLSSNSLTATLQPALEGVSAQLQESSSAAVLDEDEIVYIARAATRQRIMSVDLSVGSRLPAHYTSMGRILLAHLPPGDLEACLARLKLQPPTEHALASRPSLRAAIEQARREEYAVVDQELEIGLRSIAVPIRTRAGEVIAAMNVSVQAGRVTRREMETRFLPVLQQAAGETRALLVP